MTEAPQPPADLPVATVRVHVDGVLPDRIARLRAMVDQVLGPDGPGGAVFSDRLDGLEGAAGRVLILHPAPAAALVQALAAGIPARQALDDWCTRTRALLGFVRRNRRRAALIDEDAFLADPPGALAAAGLPVTAQAAPPAGDPGPPDPLHLLIGAELLRRDSVAHALSGELEASATVSAPPPSAPDLDAAFRAHCDALQASARLGEVAIRAGEQDAARIAAETAAAERDRQIATLEAALAAQRAEVAETRARLMRVETDHAALQGRLAEAQEEQDAIFRQLRKSQDTAEHRRAERARVEETLDATRQVVAAERAANTQLEQALAEARDKADTLEQTVERQTQQIHQLRQGMESGERHLETLQAEQEALRQEVITLEQALDASRVKLGESREALEERDRAAGTLRAEIARLKDELAARFEELSVLTARLEAVEAEHRTADRAQAEALDQSHAALTRRTKALEDSKAETARLQGELAARFEELSVLTARLEARDAELAHIYGSNSYRVTAPLRWLRATLTPGG